MSGHAIDNRIIKSSFFLVRSVSIWKLITIMCERQNITAGIFKALEYESVVGDLTLGIFSRVGPSGTMEWEFNFLNRWYRLGSWRHINSDWVLNIQFYNFIIMRWLGLVTFKSNWITFKSRSVILKFQPFWPFNFQTILFFISDLPLKRWIRYRWCKRAIRL